MASAAIRYAKALAEVVLARHQTEAVEAELQTFSKCLSESADLARVLANPAVPSAQKKNLIRAVGKSAPFSATTRNFLLVLVDHQRVDLFEEILKSFRRELDKRLGIASVEVISATALSDAQRQSLAARLRTFTQKEVRLEFQTNAQLIGGVVTKIGSTVYDGSLREQLQQLRVQLGSEQSETFNS